jgi:hypothetical protein
MHLLPPGRVPSLPVASVVASVIARRPPTGAAHPPNGMGAGGLGPPPQLLEECAGPVPLPSVFGPEPSTRCILSAAEASCQWYLHSQCERGPCATSCSGVHPKQAWEVLCSATTFALRGKSRHSGVS